VSSSQVDGGRDGVLAAGEDLELAGLELENHGPCNPTFLARSGPDLFREAPDHRLGFGNRYVMLERVLGGDGFGRPVGNYFARVNAAGEFMEPEA
jgi:hypothetical protein